jgi:6-phosphogluconolactonase/glucosamine-6-phosphate isomerase/deaminase
MLKRIDLNGWWKIKFDEDNQGTELGWPVKQPEGCLDIHVPSCWNEVFPEYHSYDGTAWYFKEIYVAPQELFERVTLCFEGVNYCCDVFLNGKQVGAHEGGFTFFDFDVSQFLQSGVVNLLVIRVNGEHDQWTLPPRNPDWFNYNGIYRPLYLDVSRAIYFNDFRINSCMNGLVTIQANITSNEVEGRFLLFAKISDQLGIEVAHQEIEIGDCQDPELPVRIEIQIPSPRLWRLMDSYLYSLILELRQGTDQLCDRVEKRFGLREIRIDGQKVLINGEEVKLVGCAKHDEYPLTGRTVSRLQLVRDYDLLRQMNANFVRLAHYPHNRLEHEVLNELGIAAISEAPLVFLQEEQMTNEVMLEKAKRMLAEMIRTEKNETCIIFWSLFIECDTHLPGTKRFVKEIVEYVKSLDETRLIIMASIRPLEDVTYDYFDVIGVNYWEGWYQNAPAEQAVDWLTTMARRFPNKPLLITSHGWDGIYNERSYIEKIHWSEDLQSDYLRRVADIFQGFKNIVGEIIWNFADFGVSSWDHPSQPPIKSPRYLLRPLELNHKGMVDFYRRPKSTYYNMKEKFAEWQEYIASPLYYGRGLRTRIFSNRRLAGNMAAFDFVDKVQKLMVQKDVLNVLFASASSQIEFIQGLLRNHMFVEWDRINAFQLDEYVNVCPDTSYGLAHWIRTHLVDHLPFRSFECLNGRAKNLSDECRRYASIMEEREIDLACLGIGENGHMAFNDPPVADFADSTFVKIVELEETSREQQFRDGAFMNIEEVPRQALTVTIPGLLRAHSILCVVTSSFKSIAVWKTLYGDISTACPASILRQHPDVALYLDRDSAALLPVMKGS